MSHGKKTPGNTQDILDYVTQLTGGHHQILPEELGEVSEESLGVPAQTASPVSQYRIILTWKYKSILISTV